ncbi:hypothetical protein LZQ00_00725 [Sphingobacterium sp. SRCM116780]|uniref:hypothetical protein n=1 Tax=Sphingobacterium sp. SRCM116780 TaxID=2907623 RepID=UPI001F400DE7|nr:hypothetical protein [Sphingobacterium sp. SRCM116780]UIR56366.1 hypothetical protein LZQ00_00725 [Sphingobacterium sp. SRCM116780]
MSATFIEYNYNKGFWVEEEFMQLVYCYICDELKKIQYNLTNKDDLLYSIKFHIDGYSTGSMSLGWNDYIITQSDEQLMLQVLQNVKATLQAKGTYISVTELQAISTEDKDFKRLFSRKPFPTAELIKIIDALIKMLEGTWDSTNYSMKIDYQY